MCVCVLFCFLLFCFVKFFFVYRLMLNVSMNIDQQQSASLGLFTITEPHKFTQNIELEEGTQLIDIGVH